MRTSKIAKEVFLHVAAFLLANHHAANAINRRQPARHGGIIAKETIALEFHELCERHPHIIQKEGSSDMAGNLHALPGAEVAVDLASHGFQLLLHAANLAAEVDVSVFGLLFELLDLLLEFDEGFFKIQGLFVHGRVI